MSFFAISKVLYNSRTVKKSQLNFKAFKSAGYSTGAFGEFHINPLGGNIGFDITPTMLEEDQNGCSSPERWYPNYLQKHGIKFPNGVPPHTLMKMGGWSSIETVQQFYLKTSDANEKKAVEMLDRLMEEETFRA